MRGTGQIHPVYRNNAVPHGQFPILVGHTTLRDSGNIYSIAAGLEGLGAPAARYAEAQPPGVSDQGRVYQHLVEDHLVACRGDGERRRNAMLGLAVDAGGVTLAVVVPHQTGDLPAYFQYKYRAGGLQDLHGVVMTNADYGHTVHRQYLVPDFEPRQVRRSALGDPRYEDALVVALEGGRTPASCDRETKTRSGSLDVDLILLFAQLDRRVGFPSYKTTT